MDETPLPPEYVPIEQWPEFHLPATIPALMHPETVPGKTLGVRWRTWPCTFEQYVSDDEPSAFPPLQGARTPIRVIEWQRISREDRPRGWVQWSKRPESVLGFAALTNAEYFHEWSKTARWDRKQWLEKYADISYRVEPISLPEFRQALKKSSLKPLVRADALGAIEPRLALDSGSVRLLGARHHESGEVRAGMALIDSPTYRSSYYLAGFVHATIGNAPVMTGLMDRWFSNSVRKNFRMLHFGRFWKPGDSAARKGFSAFKAKFGVRYVTYPPFLYKFLRN